ncbi:MAG: hypothetical protein K0R08_1050, partial [Solimicrobium sp.]|nr:hypothetical protein [Solimicrobium sp.]
NALYGLQNLTPSVGVEAVLNALAPHISHALRLSPQEIGNALYGLQNLTAGAGVEAVLNALTQQINITFKEETPSPIFVAETLCSLSLLLQKKLSIASHLVNTLLSKTNNSTEIKKLHSIET